MIGGGREGLGVARQGVGRAGAEGLGLQGNRKERATGVWLGAGWHGGQGRGRGRSGTASTGAARRGWGRDGGARHDAAGRGLVGLGWRRSGTGRESFLIAEFRHRLAVEAGRPSKCLACRGWLAKFWRDLAALTAVTFGLLSMFV